MKKLATVLMTGLMAISLIGCTSSGSEMPQETAGKKQLKIGITQIMEHPSLDDARKGFEDELKAKGIDAQIIYKNAQGDMATTSTIAQKFVDDKVDLIYAISTPSAQAAKQATSDIPVIFSAVTDPEKSEITGENITGVSDKTPMKEQLSLFNKLDKNIKTVGIIFSTSETNSQIQVEEAKKIAPELGLKIVDIGINNINDMPQGIDALIGKSDAIYMITDNLVAKSIDLLSSKVNDAKKIMIMSYIDSSDSSKNILLSNGVSYLDFGRQAADMAIDILQNGKKPSDIPVGYAEKTTNVVSTKVAEKIGLDMNNEVVKEAKKID